MKSNRPRIVVLDGYCLNPGDNPWTEFESLGDLVVYDRTSALDVIQRCNDTEIAITNKTPINGVAIGHLPKLKYIGVLATGYDLIDIEAAKRQGIPISNIPEYGTNSVAQYVFALILELCHYVGLHNLAVINGEWTRSADFSFWKKNLVEIFGKCIGIIGFGRIGQRVGEIAHAFGMEVIAADINPKGEPNYKPFSWASIEQIFARSDVVSINCSLTSNNEEFVNKRLLSLMKKSAFLINASRGKLVNEHDLAEALNSGSIAGAAVDVVSSEPMMGENPLLQARNIIITPHIAWASLESRKRLMHIGAENLRAYLEGVPKNLV